MSRRLVLIMVGMLVATVLTDGVGYGEPYAAAWTPECEETIQPPPPKCAGLDCSDPMFTIHRTRRTHVSDHCAELPVPLPYYDGEVAILAGPADMAVLRAVTAGSGYYPVATADGHAIAALGVADFRDTGVGPYQEIVMAFPVNHEKSVVATENPYVYLSELFKPANKIWFHKLLLSELMPIDWGREVIGFDKNPVPQDIRVGMTADQVTFAAADPQGESILSGNVAVDGGPAAQAQAVSQLVAAGGEWLEPLVKGGGLLPANFVSPDVLARTDELIRSHILIRIKSTPTLGRLGPDSAMKVNPNSEFGAALDRFALRPEVTGRLPLRMVLDTGWAQPGKID